MDQENYSDISIDAKTLGRKSWTAYFSLVLLTLFIFPILVAGGAAVSPVAGTVVAVICLAYLVYRVLLIRSYRIYMDAAGVWVYSGVLPWRRGAGGVKWRDLDEAVFFQSLWSWMFRSYSIRIGHRFTKSSEIFLTHIGHGDKVAMEINDHHMRLISADKLR